MEELKGILKWDIGRKEIIITDELGAKIFEVTGIFDIEINPNDKVVSVTEVNGRKHITYCTA